MLGFAAAPSGSSVVLALGFYGGIFGADLNQVPNGFRPTAMAADASGSWIYVGYQSAGIFETMPAEPSGVALAGPDRTGGRGH